MAKIISKMFERFLKVICAFIRQTSQWFDPFWFVNSESLKFTICKRIFEFYSIEKLQNLPTWAAEGKYLQSRYSMEKYCAVAANAQCLLHLSCGAWSSSFSTDIFKFVITNINRLMKSFHWKPHTRKVERHTFEMRIKLHQNSRIRVNKRPKNVNFTKKNATVIIPCVSCDFRQKKLPKGVLKSLKCNLEFMVSWELLKICAHKNHQLSVLQSMVLLVLDLFCIPFAQVFISL